MKTAIVLFLMIGFTSCKERIDTGLLIGTWKTKNETDHSSGSITFSADGTIMAQTFSYGRMVSEISGKYKVDPESELLNTSYADGISYELKIKKLTKNELELYYMKTKQSQNYFR